MIIILVGYQHFNFNFNLDIVGVLHEFFFQNYRDNFFSNIEIFSEAKEKNFIENTEVWSLNKVFFSAKKISKCSNAAS